MTWWWGTFVSEPATETLCETMNNQTLRSIFVEELGGKATGERIDLPTGTRVTVFISTHGVPIPIPKVTGMTLRKAFAIFDSEDGRVFTHMDEFAAVRADEEATANDRVGF
jgi:hypothetical protein